MKPINKPYRDENEDQHLDQDQDHPDAPLPIKSSNSTTQRYSDHPDTEYANECQQENDQDGYNCQSSRTSQDLENEGLAESEPRPIDDENDEFDEYQAANRPRHAWQILWLRNKGMALVLLAQMFGASMNVMTQILEIHSAMHPFQVHSPPKSQSASTHAEQ
jgi:hypothetical protein